MAFSILLLLPASVVVVWAYHAIRRWNRLPHPPGPKGLPILGNLFDLPKSHEYLVFTEWKKSFGDLIYLNILGRPILILNSYDAAKDLLDKRSMYYSDRPYMPMAGELMGWHQATAISPFNDRFRAMRKMFAQTVGGKNAEQFWPQEEREIRTFLINLLEAPQHLSGHLRRFTGTVILDISHGYEVKGLDDPFVKLAELTMGQFSDATSWGAFYVDFIPAMKYIPSWFPFADFKKKAAIWRQNLTDTVELPYNIVKDELKNGIARPSFLSKLLDEGNWTEEELDIIKYVAFGIYTGGSDTAVAVLHTFFLLMVLYPEVQKRTQEEIDGVCKNERLPTMLDRESLPYTEAVMLEALRWGPIAPTAFPHRLMQDDEYRGYRIPEGTLCFANLWAMMHDPVDFPEPYKFNPDRYFTHRKETKDPRLMVFGFGRRICPGRALADGELFLAVAAILAAFNIGKAVDDQGKEITPEAEYISGTVCKLKDFSYNISPRSEKAVELVRLRA